MKNFVTSDLRTDEKMNHAGGQGLCILSIYWIRKN